MKFFKLLIFLCVILCGSFSYATSFEFSSEKPSIVAGTPALSNIKKSSSFRGSPFPQMVEITSHLKGSSVTDYRKKKSDLVPVQQKSIALLPRQKKPLNRIKQTKPNSITNRVTVQGILSSATNQGESKLNREIRRTARSPKKLADKNNDVLDKIQKSEAKPVTDEKHTQTDILPSTTSVLLPNGKDTGLQSLPQTTADAVPTVIELETIDNKQENGKSDSGKTLIVEENLNNKLRDQFLSKGYNSGHKDCYLGVNKKPLGKQRKLYMSNSEAVNIINKKLSLVQPLTLKIKKDPDFFWTTESDIIFVNTQDETSKATVYSGRTYFTHLNLLTTDFNVGDTFRPGTHNNNTNLLSLHSTSIDKHAILNDAWNIIRGQPTLLNRWCFEFNYRSGELSIHYSATGPIDSVSKSYLVVNILDVLANFVIPNSPWETLRHTWSKLTNKSQSPTITSMSHLSKMYLTGKCELCAKYESVQGAVKIAKAILKGVLYRQSQSRREKRASEQYNSIFKRKQKDFARWFKNNDLSPLSNSSCGNPSRSINISAVNFLKKLQKLQLFHIDETTKETLVCEISLINIVGTVPSSLQQSPRIIFNPPLKLYLSTAKQLKLLTGAYSLS